MTSFILGILFLFNLGIALGLGWVWASLRNRQRELEQKMLESIDDQDLSAFQDSVQELIADLRKASDEGVFKIENASDALDSLLKKADAAEKKMTRRLESLEKGQEKLEKGLNATIEKALKAVVPAGKGKKAPSSSPIDTAQFLKALSGQTQADPAPLVPEVPQLKSLPRQFSPDFGSETVDSRQEPEPETKLPRDRVVGLSKQGLSKQEIVAATGLLPGEVELILNLRAPR